MKLYALPVQSFEVPRWHSVECRVPPLAIGNFAQVSLQDFFPILATLRPKIPIRYFWPVCKQMGKIWKFSPGKSILLRTLHQWCVKFLSKIFYLFWPPYSRKFWFDIFSRGATSWYFWPVCNQNLCSVLSTMVWPFPFLSTFNQWCNQHGVKA